MNYTIPEFFEAIENDELSSLEQHNFVQKLTDNFDDYKVELLSKDLKKLFTQYLKQLCEDLEIHYFEDEKRTLRELHSYSEEVYKNAFRLTLLPIKVKTFKKLKEKSDSSTGVPEESNESNKEDQGLPEVDLSGSPATEKLIYLKELGVLDFLLSKDPYNKSVRKLALTLVPILGEKYGTIQPIVNPMVKNSYSKNNPYSNPNNQKVEKVRQHLIELGFKVNDN